MSAFAATADSLAAHTLAALDPFDTEFAAEVKSILKLGLRRAREIISRLQPPAPPEPQLAPASALTQTPTPQPLSYSFLPYGRELLCSITAVRRITDLWNLLSVTPSASAKYSKPVQSPQPAHTPPDQVGPDNLDEPVDPMFLELLDRLDQLATACGSPDQDIDLCDDPEISPLE